LASGCAAKNGSPSQKKRFENLQNSYQKNIRLKNDYSAVVGRQTADRGFLCTSGKAFSGKDLRRVGGISK
jgi:hypothetical protein